MEDYILLDQQIKNLEQINILRLEELHSSNIDEILHHYLTRLQIQDELSHLWEEVTWDTDWRNIPLEYTFYDTDRIYYRNNGMSISKINLVGRSNPEIIIDNPQDLARYTNRNQLVLEQMTLIVQKGVQLRNEISQLETLIKNQLRLETIRYRYEFQGSTYIIWFSGANVYSMVEAENQSEVKEKNKRWFWE